MHTQPRLCGSWIFVGPFEKKVWFPEDWELAVRIESDGRVYSVEYYPLRYGEIYRYRGHELPRSAHQWAHCRYIPQLEYELAIVKLAAAGVRFRDIMSRVRRPRLEVCAILDFHGYPGLQYARLGD